MDSEGPWHRYGHRLGQEPKSTGKGEKAADKNLGNLGWIKEVQKRRFFGDSQAMQAES